MNCRIKQIDKDERFETRVMELSISGKRIVTPLKTIDKVGSVGEVNEISLRVDKGNIVDACMNTGNTLNNLSSRVNRNSINVIIPEYVSYGFTVDGRDILSKMESRIHTNTDIVVVPRWKGVLDLKNGGLLQDNLITHSKLFIEESRKLNGKLIMGNLPLNTPESVIDAMVRFYLDEGITSFVLDYCTCLPRGKEHIVRGIQKALIDSGDYETSILYSTNVRRTHKIGTVYPADDLMTFCHGVDFIGSLHIGGGGGKPKNGIEVEPKTKEFIPSQYTYVEKIGLTQKQKDELKIRNCRLQNEETKKISSEIMENRSSYNFIKDKSGAKEYIEKSKQKKLDFGFSV
ncbi:MAG: hypothetical protein AB7E75_03010 [Candidatus Methanomethylophilaceae archaeon]